MLFVSVSYSQSYTKTTYLVDIEKLHKITSVSSLTIINNNIPEYPCLKTNLYYFTSSYAIIEMSTDAKTGAEKNFVDNLVKADALIKLYEVTMGNFYNGRIGGYERICRFKEFSTIKVNISSTSAGSVSPK
jgi:hypothetical protein